MADPDPTISRIPEPGNTLPDANITIQNPEITRGSSNSDNRQAALDGWRGLASLMVFWHHTGTAILLPPIVIWFWTGVHFFFVLSGYLIFRPFLNAMLSGQPSPKLSLYLRRRFARIYPPYLVALAVAVLARYVTGRKPPDLWTIVTHAGFVYNYFADGNLYRINGVFWTLMIEAQFYLLLPLLVMISRKVCQNNPHRSVWLVLGIFLVVGPCARAIEFFDFGLIHLTNSSLRYQSVFSFLDMFGFGMLAGYLQVLLGSSVSRSSLTRVGVLGVGITLFLTANYYAFVQEASDWMTSPNLVFILWFPTLLCSGIGLILLAVVCSERGGILSWKPIVAVGTISYSLYLYHILVQVTLFQFVNLSTTIANVSIHGFVYGLIFLIPTLLFSTMAYILVEKPSLAWSKSFRR